MDSNQFHVTKNKEGGYVLKDSNIYQADIDTLDDGSCLNDMIMHFYLRLLEIKYQTEKQPKKIQFVMPCTIQFIQAFPLEMVQESLTDDFLKGYNYIILPLSDFNTQSLSSTHWSLLILAQTDKNIAFYHFDSMNQSNSSHARNLAEKISSLISKKTYDFNTISSDSQINSFDCGVYVLRYIKSFLDNNYDLNKVVEGITPEEVHQFRHQIRQEIEDSFPKE